MNHKIKILMLSISLMGVIFLSSCDNSTNPANPGVKPNAVTALMAQSALDEGTVGLKWTHSTSVNDSLFKGYEVEVTGGGPMTPLSVDKLSNKLNVMNLTAGVEYTFTVYAVLNDGTKSDGVSIKWSPALIFPGIKLYESASTTYGSGLRLYDDATQGPVVYKVANGDKWDIGLDTKDNSWDIGSVGSLSYSSFQSLTLRKTYLLFADKYKGMTSLADVYETALAAPTTEQILNFNNVTAGFIMVLLTQDGHYAKVLVKANGTTILQGTAPNRYVEIDVAYQPTANKPYALLAPANNTGKNFRTNLINGGVVTDIKKIAND